MAVVLICIFPVIVSVVYILCTYYLSEMHMSPITHLHTFPVPPTHSAHSTKKQIIGSIYVTAYEQPNSAKFAKHEHTAPAVTKVMCLTKNFGII